MSNTRDCEFCGETIPEDEHQCHHCGERRQEKACAFCAEAIPANAKKCRHCGEWVQGQSSRSAAFHVPAIRRSSLNSVFVLLGFCVLPPLLWITCVLLLTGDIYYDELGADGKPKTWSFANKVVAVLLLLVQLVAVVANVVQAF